MIGAPPPLLRRRSRFGIVAALASLSLLATACSGSSSGSSDSSGGSSGSAGGTQSSGSTTRSTDTLTVDVVSPPVSLNPYLQNVDPVNNWFVNLAYDSLIRIGADGKLAPDLATSWKFLDSANTQFQMTIRSGVKFSDGTPLTAQAVAASANYAFSNGTNGKVYWGPISSITATDANTVLFTSSSSNPGLPNMITNRVLLGSVVSPTGISNPDSLKSATAGAGPYILNSGSTVANDTYVYDPNPNYWDQSKIAFAHVKLKVVANTAAALQDVQSGAAQLFRGDADTYTAAKAANLHIETVAIGLLGVNYVDRTGAVAPQLKDVRVRQALNYAMNINAIAKATFGELGAGGGELALPGTVGYDKSIDNAYPYDVAKAKKLLSDAGYASGFTMPVEVVTTSPTADIMMQAVIADWAKIGVTAKLTTYTATGPAVSDILAKKYAVTYYGYGSLTPFTIQSSFLSGTANQYNPWGTTDSELTADLQKAATTSGADQTAALTAAFKRSYVDLAWYGGVIHSSYPYISDGKKITGTAHTTNSGTVDIAWGVRAVK
ncbi:MAG: Peptide/nickel transport system substrate-binding protein [Pseudonocardiales bacterium]|nr:Peptide/nickel transport system substrate-binding protein [Pseudonocardiales bacterium]